MQRVWVPFFVGELKSYLPCDVAKKKKKKKNLLEALPLGLRT